MSRTSTLFLIAVVVLVTLPAGAAAMAPDEAAASSGSPVTLTVSVVDRGGDPVGGAEVTATWDGDEKTATTAANGKVFVDVPAGADVTLTVKSDQYVRNFPVTVSDASQRDVRITVAEKGSARIRVTDAAGDPVGNAEVRLLRGGASPARGTTNANGVFESGTVEQGEYAVRVVKQGYYANRTSLSVTGDVSKTVAVSRGSVTVQFTVSDDHFDSPRAVENASVRVAGVGTVQTLSDGGNTMSVPVNGVYEVSITKGNYTEATPKLWVNEHKTTLSVVINRTPRVSVEAASNRVVVGEPDQVTVTDEYGAPVANASVTFDGEHVGETDADGQLSFTVEGAGAHEVAATKGSLSATTTIHGFDPNATTTAAGTEGTGTTDSTGAGPGFTALAALAGALVALGALGARR
ncbi:MAG: carboxypeptidase-like regulatory domain-containing protein [Haloarculaceae archaeon]